MKNNSLKSRTLLKRQYQKYLLLASILAGLVLTVFIYISPEDTLPTPYNFQEPATYDQPFLASVSRYLLSVRPINANAVAKVADGQAVKYLDAYNNTDVVQTKSANKLKEDIILKQPGHPEKFTYQINLEIYDYQIKENGDIIFYPKGKKGDELYRLFTIPASFMTDAQGNKSSVEEVETTLTDQGILTITPSQDWLAQAVYPVILDPTIEINILNVYSHPSQGDNWEVSFTTQGQADLKIIPNDQATIDDDEFVSLSCNGETKQPQILPGDIIYYSNWQCNDIAKVIHYTKKAGHHTLRFEFGSQTAYAYNDSSSSWLSGWEHRKAVTLSRPSGAVTDYQMKLMVGESAYSPSAIFLQNLTYSSYGALGYNAAEFYEGGAFKDSTSTRYLTRVDARLIKSAGDVSSKHFECKIWTKASSSNNLGTLVATSNVIAGNNAWSATWVTFTFSRPVTLNTGTEYQITISPQEAPDSTNYISLDMATENNFGGSLAFAYWGTNYAINWWHNTQGPMMKLYFKDVDCNSLVQADFDDLRFTKADGLTLLDYWIESATGTTPNQLATTWVEFDSIGTGATTFYMYYGNKDAASASNGSSTFLFFDHFLGDTLDAAKWDATNSPTIVVASSSVKVTSATAAWRAIESKSSFGEHGIVWRAKGSLKGADFNWFGVGEDYNMAATYKNRLSFFWQVVNRTAYVMNRSTQSWDYVSGGDASEHIYEITSMAALYKYYVDGVLRKTHTTPTLTSSVPMKVIAAISNTTTEAQMDWVLIRQYDTTEPSWGGWGPDEGHVNYISTPLTNRFKDSSLVLNMSFNGADMNWGSTTAEALDRSGNSNNGDVIGGAKPDIGINGQALSFDGVDDYVDMGDINTIDGVSQLTVSAWVKHNSLKDDALVVSKYDSIEEGWFLKTEQGLNSDEIVFGVAWAATGRTTENVHTIGVWENWVGVFDGTQTGNANRLKIYLNGIQRTLTVGTIPATTLDTSNNVFIGARDDFAGSYWNGSIDEVRIYNRALSISEIQSLYKAGTSRVKVNTPSPAPSGLSSGLVGNWTFNGADMNISAPYSDNFDRANENPLAGNWTTATGQSAMKLSSNSIVASVLSAQNGSYWNSGTFTADQYAQVKLLTLDNYQGVILRHGTNYYYAYIRNGPTRVRLNRWDGGSGTILTTINAAVNVGDVLKADIVGTLITMYINGVPVGNYDDTGSSVTSGQPGITTWGADTTTSVLDDFQAGSFILSYDRSGQNPANNGTIFGAKPDIGINGQALSFDGVDDYMKISDNSSLDVTAGQNMTYSLWVKTTQGMEVDKWPNLFNKEKLNPQHGFDMSLHDSTSDARWSFSFVNNGTNWIGAYGQSDVADGKWHHLVVTKDGNVGKAYQDGIFSNSVTDDLLLATDFSNASSTCIGIFSCDDPALYYPFKGLIDEVRVYNRALTPAEIQTLYNLGATRKAQIKGN